MDWPSHIISLVNEAGPDFPESRIDHQHGDHHIYNFHDTEDPNDEIYVVPPRSDIEEILQITGSLGVNDKLLIHCTAGKSRSTAVGIGVLIQHGMTPREALDWMKNHRPAMFPNRLIIGYIDDILRLDKELIDVVDAYYNEKILLIPGLQAPNRGWNNR